MAALGCLEDSDLAFRLAVPRLLVVAALAAGLAEPGSAEDYDPLFDEEPAFDREPEDPYERANRAVFDFNDALDCRLLDPITRAYQFVLPLPARRSVTRFFGNLNAPVEFTNEMLQLRPRAAATTLGRFVSNSTLGVAGLFDPADAWLDLSPSDADFGQTLHRYGIPRGPYLVLPFFGPSTARDTIGTLVDQGLNPLTYIAGPLNLQWRLLIGGGQGLALKESNRAALLGLRDASVDYYAALRSAYLQTRRGVEHEAELGRGP